MTMSKFQKDNTLVECPRCGRTDATLSWIESNGQCGSCGRKDEVARVRALDVSPEAIAARLKERSDRRPDWAPEDDERDRETRALIEALADAERRAGELELAEAIMGREIVVDEEDPDEARWRRGARTMLEKWHAEPHEQENAVVTLLFRERQRSRDAAEFAIQDVLTEENVRAALEGTEQNGAPMDVPRLRIRALKRFHEHQAAGTDLSGKPLA